MKLINQAKKFGTVVTASGALALAGAFPSMAASTGSTGTLSDTLNTFSSVFEWFLKEGGLLLSWMLDKPIILLSLSVFFVGAVIGVLGRIYNSF